MDAIFAVKNWSGRLIALPVLTLHLLLLTPIVALLLGATWSEVLAALSDGETLPAIALTLACALLAVALGLILGVPTGWWLAQNRSRWSRLTSTLIDLPLVLPHPLLGIGLLLIFGRHQLIGSALRENFGISVASATPGIVLAMTIVSAPFIVKAARDGFASVPAPLMRTARSLGASEWASIWTVAVPLARPHLQSGAVLAWARAVSEFGSIVILAYFPMTAPVLIWDRFSSQGLSAALAPAVLLLIACLGILLLLTALHPAPNQDRT